MAESKCISKNCLKFKLQQRRLNSEFTDVTLVCKDEISFHAHKCILQNASPYWANILQYKPENGLVHVDFDSRTLSTILDIAYLDVDAIVEPNDMNELEALLHAAHVLQMKSVMGYCCSMASGLMNPQDLVRIYSWNHQFQYKDIETLLNDCVDRFRDTIVDYGMYLDYTLQQFTLLVDGFKPLPDEDEKVEEDNVIEAKRTSEAIITWVKAKKDERNQHTAALFSKIAIKYLPLGFVQKTLLDEEILKTNAELMFLLLKNIEPGRDDTE